MYVGLPQDKPVVLHCWYQSVGVHCDIFGLLGTSKFAADHDMLRRQIEFAAIALSGR
jgi:hypothetical protein